MVVGLVLVQYLAMGMMALVVVVLPYRVMLDQPQNHIVDSTLLLMGEALDSWGIYQCRNLCRLYGTVSPR